MNYNVYAIRDVMTGFMSPTLDQNNQVAIRNFAVAITHGQSMIHARPQDFDLYKIGTYDTESGCLVGFATPEFVIAGASIVNAKEEKDENT